MVAILVRTVLVALSLASLGGCGPLAGNFIGEGTSELSTALLQGFVTEDDNQVFSPLGYSAVLAIFAEGARGESRQEIATALHFPDDVNQVRAAYKKVLTRLMTKNYTGENGPELKNWFYIYKNSSVEEDLQKVLREFYLTEVKVVERPEDYVSNDKKVQKQPMEEAKPEEMKVEKIKVEEMKVEEMRPETVASATQAEPSEENVLIPVTETDGAAPVEISIDIEKTVASAVDSVNKAHTVDSEEATSNNVQNNEEPTLLADKPKEDEEELPGTHNVRDRNHLVQEKEEEQRQEVETATVNVVVVEEPQEHEAMVMEQRSSGSAFGSPDHFSGMTDSSIKIKNKGPESQMIIFNGLYYRGDWKTPFVKKPAHESRVFYKSEKEKVSVSTIHSEGQYLAGDIPSIDSKAIELPYKGDRYSLLLVVPNSRDGLSKLIADLDGISVSSIRGSLGEKAVEICLPTFEITTIAKPISSLSKLGMSRVTSIFDPVKADLSGISKTDPDLYVEELVQMVTFKVDGDHSETNLLTASEVSSRTDYERFQINHPFLFFLRDNIEDIVVVVGKVVDPTPKPDFFSNWEKEEDI